MRQPHRFAPITRRRPGRAAAPGLTLAELLIVVVITSIQVLIANTGSGRLRAALLAPSGAARGAP